MSTSINSLLGLPSLLSTMSGNQDPLSPANITSNPYPPGSGMDNFLKDLNQRTAAATMGPNGQNVETWAQGLATQAAQRKALGQTAGAGATGAGATAAGAAGGTPMAMIQSLMQQLMTMLTQLKTAK